MTVYSSSPINRALCQGEILCDIQETRIVLQSRKTDDPEDIIEIEQIPHKLSIVLTADCDLLQDYNIRQWLAGKAEQPDSITDKNAIQNMVHSVLLCELYLASDFKPWATKSWSSIQENKLQRYQFLCNINPHEDLCQEGIPSMVADFRRYYSVSPDEIYWRIENQLTQRRSILSAPYLQQLTIRFSQHLSRVALDVDHHDMCSEAYAGDFNQLTENQIEDTDLFPLEEALKQLDG